jgi:hypothetical protein
VYCDIVVSPEANKGLDTSRGGSPPGATAMSLSPLPLARSRASGVRPVPALGLEPVSQ